MTCKQICKEYKASKPYKSGHYVVGHKRCVRCDTFMKYRGINCPCCGYKLRQNPRNSKFKQKLQNKNGIKRI